MVWSVRNELYKKGDIGRLGWGKSTVRQIGGSYDSFRSRDNCAAGDYTVSHSYRDRSEQIWYYPPENTHLIKPESRIHCVFFCFPLLPFLLAGEEIVCFIGFLIPVQTTVEGETQYLAVKKWGLVLLPAVKLADLQAQHRLCGGFDLSHFIISVTSWEKGSAQKCNIISFPKSANIKKNNSGFNCKAVTMWWTNLLLHLLNTVSP